MIHRLPHLIRASLVAWWDDRALSMGAAIAFYTIFSLAPILLIVIAVGGLVFGADAAQAAVIAQIGGLVGPEGVKQIGAILASASNLGSGLIGTLVGIVTFLFTATAAFTELQADLNIIWRVEPRRYSGIVNFLFSRMMSLALIAALSFLLLVSLTFDALASAATQYVRLEGWAYLVGAINLAVSIAMSGLLFAFIFKMLPDVRVPWSKVMPGAFLTALLFVIGKIVIGIYLGQSNIASSYGAAASVITLLLWVYYSAQILLWGAQFTKIYAAEPARQKKVRAKARVAHMRPTARNRT